MVKFSGDKSKLCFVGLWAYNPPAALEAVRSAKLVGTTKIVGFDEDDQTLVGIQDGSIVGTVVIYHIVGAMVGSLRVDPETETVGLDLAEHGEEGGREECGVESDGGVASD